METSITRLLGWRDFLHARPDRVRGDVEYYCDRAKELREQVELVLGAGLTEGAEQALSDLAEEDMVDFCILVDLANEVDIPEVDPLAHDDAHTLRLFFDGEPWHSLLVDCEINVTLAMLRASGETDSETIWHREDPYLLTAVSRALDAANKEQLGRFTADVNALSARLNAGWDQEVTDFMEICINRAASRLGAPHVAWNTQAGRFE